MILHYPSYTSYTPSGTDLATYKKLNQVGQLKEEVVLQVGMIMNTQQHGYAHQVTDNIL